LLNPLIVHSFGTLPCALGECRHPAWILEKEEERLVRGKTAFFPVLLWLMIWAAIASAASSKAIDESNEYGGITEERTFSAGDAAFDVDGIQKLVSYYDGNGNVRVRETHFTEASSGKDGVEKLVRRFSDRGSPASDEYDFRDDSRIAKGVARLVRHYGEDGRKTHEEYFYTDTSSRKDNVFRMVRYFDAKGKKIRDELHSTGTYAAMTGFSKLVRAYDGDENPAGVQVYDRDGKIVEEEPKSR